MVSHDTDHRFLAMSHCRLSSMPSVAVALAGVFAILINKIYKIMEIFE